MQYKTKCAKAAGSDGGANNRTPLQLHLTNGRTSDAVIAMIQYCSLLWHSSYMIQMTEEEKVIHPSVRFTVL